MKKCPQCNQDNPDNAVFCAFCGYKFSGNVCKVCNQQNPPNEVFCVKCGNPLTDAPVVIEGRYKLLKKVGVGGFGKTFLAEDLQLFGKNVVIKEFSMQGTKFEDFSKFTQKEGMVLAKLNHPQIPKIHGFLQDKKSGKIFLVQDFVEGKNLRQILVETGKLNEDEAIILLKDVLDILYYLHSFQPPLVHRDIKPENIIVNNGKAFLVDYGAAIEYQPDQRDREIIYTKGYAAPQQKQGYSSPSTDLYSLGIVAIEMLTGLTPDKFVDEERNIDYSIIKGLSVELRDFLSKMTKPSPIDRFKNAHEAKTYLEVVEKIRTLREIKINQFQGKIGEKERKEVLEMAKKLNIPLDLMNKVLDEEKHRTAASYQKSTTTSSPFITRFSIASQSTAVTTVRLLGKVQAHQGTALKVIFSPKGEFMLTAGTDGVIKVFGTSQWERKISIKGTTEEDTITDLKISPNSQYLAVATRNGLVKFYETVNWTRLSVTKMQNDEISEITFSPESRFLLAGGYENVITVFDMLRVEKILNLSGHQTWISTLDHSPKKYILVSGSWDGNIIVWNTSEFKQINSSKEHMGQVKKIKFAPSGEFYVSIGGEGRINIWDANSFKITKTYQITEDTKNINDIAITSDNKTLLIVFDTKLMVIDLDLMEKKTEIDLQTKRCTSLAILSQRNYFATSDIEGTIKLWKLTG